MVELMEHEKVRDMIVDCKKEIEALKKQNETMKEALEFYAEKDNWSYVNQNCQISMKQDAEHNVNFTATFAGKRARQALKDIE